MLAYQKMGVFSCGDHYKNMTQQDYEKLFFSIKSKIYNNKALRETKGFWVVGYFDTYNPSAFEIACNFITQIQILDVEKEKTGRHLKALEVLLESLPS